MFNDQELKVILQFIDIGIRSKGLEVAQPGSHLATKIQQELKRREEENKNSKSQKRRKDVQKKKESKD